MISSRCKTAIVLSICVLIGGFAWWQGSIFLRYLNANLTISRMSNVIHGLLPGAVRTKWADITGEDNLVAVYHDVCQEYYGHPDAVDGWDRPMKLRVSRVDGGYEVSIVSAGHDGRFETEDDISDTVVYTREENVHDHAGVPVRDIPGRQ